jgi:hypothetical protein
MVLAVCSLLLGCGSDSTPKDTTSGKKEQTAKSGMTMQTVTPLLAPKEGGTAPLQHFDKIPGRGTPEEIEAKRAAAAAAWEKLDPKQTVLPGLTKEQLEAKLEAERAKKPNPKREILPGLTQEQLDAKGIEHRKNTLQPVEVFPGLTEEAVKAKAAQARQKQQMPGANSEQRFPPR